MVNGAGNIVAAESQGPVFVRGEEIIRCDGHHAVASLDRKGIREASQLLVVPFGEGEVAIQRREGAPPLVGEVGEFQGATWKRLGGQSVLAEQALTLSVGGSSALDLRLLTAPGQTAEAMAAAAQLLNRR